MNTATTNYLDMDKLKDITKEITTNNIALELGNILSMPFLDIATNCHSLYWNTARIKTVDYMEILTKENFETTKAITPVLIDSLQKISDKTNDIFNSELKAIASAYANNDTETTAKKVNDLILDLLHIQLLIRNNLSNGLGIWKELVSSKLEKLNLDICNYIDYIKPMKNALQLDTIN